MKIVIYLLIIFSLFPYIQIIPLGTDSQPNALFFSLCLFPFICRWKMNKNLAFLLLLSIIASALLFVSPINFGTFRSLLNYYSLFFITYGTYFSFKKVNGLPYSLFKTVVWIWFLVGTVQLFVDPDFMSFLLPRGDSAHSLKTGRGIVCLAPEPTFYGIMCLFLYLIAFLNFKDKPKIKIIYVLLGIQLLIYSRSSLVVFILLASLGIYLCLIVFSKKYFLRVLLALIVLIILLHSIISLYSDEISAYRIGKLLTLLVENPKLFLIMDASANERFVHVFFPLYGCLTNWCLPHGYEGFGTFMDECFSMSEFSELFTDYIVSNPIIRIMSGWGSLFYELGIFGLILVYVIYHSISSVYTGKTRIIVLAIIGMLLMNAIPFSNPIIAFYIGNLLYVKDTFKIPNVINYS